MTNRDFYLAITAKSFTDATPPRDLEEYLRCLWHLMRIHEHAETVPAESFLQNLQSASRSDAPPFNEQWRTRTRHPSATGYTAWEQTILHQIVDLREMAEAGTLKNDQRFFGINAPRGSRWYNFTVPDYLECAAVGSMGGWQEGDATGRDYVPGEVAVMNDAGQIESRNPRELDNPTFPIRFFTWDALVDFLGCGQWYE